MTAFPSPAQREALREATKEYGATAVMERRECPVCTIQIEAPPGNVPAAIRQHLRENCPVCPGRARHRMMSRWGKGRVEQRVVARACVYCGKVVETCR